MSKKRKNQIQDKAIRSQTLIDPLGLFGGLAAALVLGFPVTGPKPRPAPAWNCPHCNINLEIIIGDTGGDIPYCPKCRGQMKPAGPRVTFGPQAIEATCEDVTHRRLTEGRKNSE